MLNQRKYALELISKVVLSASKPSTIPMEHNLNLTTNEYDKICHSDNADSLLDKTSEVDWEVNLASYD